MFLSVHMTGRGNENTIIRTNRNLRQIAEDDEQERHRFRAFLSSTGRIHKNPDSL